MMSFNNSIAQWGKLTSLNPNFENLSLSKNPTIFAVSDGHLKDCIDDDNLSVKNKCQIHQDKGETFYCYTGNDLSVEIESQNIREGEAVQLNSGNKLVVIIKKEQAEIKMEYVFSLELKEIEKNTLKRAREEHEKIELLEKKMKFDESLKDETKCILCCKMIYECVSIVPCLHSFCMCCFMLHLTGSKECPRCEERFIEFRKSVFLNNIIEAYEESWQRKDRSQEECRKITEKLENERIFARFEDGNEDIYEGEWKKCRKDGVGKMMYESGTIYEGDWKNNVRFGKGKIILKNGALYEGDWTSGLMEGKGKIIFKNGSIYEGDWRAGNVEGKGKMIGNDGSVYEGDWKAGKMEGKGKIVFIDGDSYEGDWKGNKRDGKGRMIFVNGDVFEGAWRNGDAVGQGKLIKSDGAVKYLNWPDDETEENDDNFVEVMFVVISFIRIILVTWILNHNNFTTL